MSEGNATYIIIALCDCMGGVFFHCSSPLLYGLDIVENFTALREYAFQSKDYQVTPASPWNYAVKIQDDSAVDKDLSFVHTGLMKGVPPFSKKGAPVKIVAQVCVM